MQDRIKLEEALKFSALVGSIGAVLGGLARWWLGERLSLTHEVFIGFYIGGWVLYLMTLGEMDQSGEVTRRDRRIVVAFESVQAGVFAWFAVFVVLEGASMGAPSAWPDIPVIALFSPSQCCGIGAALLYGVGKWHAMIIGPAAPKRPDRH